MLNDSLKLRNPYSIQDRILYTDKGVLRRNRIHFIPPKFDTSGQK